MRTILIWLALSALPVFGLDNCVRLTEGASQAQTNRPITIYRFFAKGEIANYPRPKVDGDFPGAWQADVKNRWQDNSVQAAYISWRQSFISGQTVTACFEDSASTSSDPSNPGLTQTELVNFNTGGGTGSWDVAVSTTLAGIEHVMNAKTMISGGAFSYWLRGPVVTRVLVEDTTSPNPLYDTGYEYDFTENTSDGWTAPLGTWMNSSVAKWHMLTWQPMRISGSSVTKGATTTFTRAAHGLTNDQSVGIYCGTQIGYGNCSANWSTVQAEYTITVTGPDTFTIPLDSSAWAAPSSSDYFNFAASRFQLGVGDANTYNPDNALAFRLNGKQYEVLVRDGGVQTTFALTAYVSDSSNLGDQLPSYASFVADGAAKRITVFYWRGGESQQTITACPSGCDITVSADFFSKSFLPLKVSTDGSGNAVPMQAANLLRGSRWKEPTAEKYKSFHPTFMLSFYPATGGASPWSGVEAETILMNPWTSRFQGLFLENLSIRTEATLSTEQFSQNYWVLSATGAFSRVVWSGTPPARIDYDFNLDYMVHSRIIPPFDSRNPEPESTLTTLLSDYDSSVGTEDVQHCITQQANCNGGYSCCGLWLKSMGAAGGRGDLGLHPNWYAMVLFTMGNSNYALQKRRDAWDKLLVGNGDAGFSWTIHHRESDTSYPTYNYPGDASASSFGRYISLRARPQLFNLGRWADPGGAQAFSPSCTAVPCSWAHPDAIYRRNDGKDTAHQPNVSALPFLLTGRYSYLLSVWAWASFNISSASPGCGAVGARCNDLGVDYLDGALRGMAWNLRSYVYAAVLTPDGMPEKDYFRHIARVQDEFFEGQFGITNGNATSTTCTGADVVGQATDYASSTHSPFSNNATNGMVPNGYNRRFGLVEGGIAAGYKPTITINGTQVPAASVCLQGTVGCSWYYRPGDAFVEQDASLPPLALGDTISVTGYRTRFSSPWCAGYNFTNGYSGALGFPGIWNSPRYDNPQVNEYTSNPPWANAPHNGIGNGGQAWYMSVFMGEVYAWARSLGIQSTGAKTMFQFSGERMASWFIGLATSRFTNKLWLSLYSGPSWNKDGRPFQNWSEIAEYVVPTLTLTNAIDSATTSIAVTAAKGPFFIAALNSTPVYWKVDNEYIRVCSWTGNTATATVCPDGRGYLGTAAAEHSQGASIQVYPIFHNTVDYTANALMALAFAQDIKTPTGSGKQAWENLVSVIHDYNTSSWNNQPKLRIRAKDEIANLRVATAASSVTLRYVAPDGRACKYAVAPGLSSSDDSSDTSDGGGSRERAVTVSGLNGGQSYAYRVTCGTARKTNQVVVP
jgi:hypothetical protein